MCEASTKAVFWLSCSLGPVLRLEFIIWIRLNKFLFCNSPNRCCPGSDLVKAMQWGFPDVAFMAGKWGSFLGTGIGQHSGWTVWAESQARQFKMESGKPCRFSNIIFGYLAMHLLLLVFVLNYTEIEPFLKLFWIFTIPKYLIILITKKGKLFETIEVLESNFALRLWVMEIRRCSSKPNFLLDLFPKNWLSREKFANWLSTV